MLSSLRIKILIVTVGIVFLTTLTTMFFVLRETEKSIYSDENKHAQNLVNTVLLNVDNEYRSLLFHKDSVLASRKEELKNIVNIVLKNIEANYQQYMAGKLDEEEAKRLSIEEIKRLRYDDDVGYIWVNDTGKPFPKMILHPILPELNGRVLDNAQYNCVLGTKENLFVASVNVCIEDGDGYVEYLWPKPSSDGLSADQPKLSYVSIFPGWSWVVGTGVYIDDIEKDTKKRQDAILVELEETFSKVKVGENGYMFIFSGDMNMLVHPTLPRGFDSSKLINSTTGKPLMGSFVETSKSSGKPFEYLWDKPDHKDDFSFWKRAYVKYYEPLDWYIVSTVYNDELELRVNALRKKILSLSLLFLAVAIFLSSLLSRSLTKPLQNLTSAAIDIDKNGISATIIPVGGTRETRELGTVLNNTFHSIIQADIALKKSEERYRSLFEHSRDSVMTLAPPTWKFTSANPAAIEMFGAKNEEDLTSLKPWEVSPARQKDLRLSNEKAMEMIETAMQNGSHLFEWAHKRTNGDEFPSTVLMSRMEWEGEPLLQATVRDITHETALEAQLVQSQKMEAVGQLAGGVAHDFNNLLTVIQGYCEFALVESKGKKMESILEEVMNAAKRAATLVRQLLAFSRKQVLELENLNMDEVVRDLAKMIQRVIGEHISFNIISEPGPKSFRADKGQIEQILMNLCVNARDAMGEGGTLTIKTSFTELDKKFCEVNAWAKTGRFVVLCISDTGLGMDEETQQRIFEPFFTTKEMGRGTGLGLSTVFGIVRQHEGMVHVYSEVGMGTTFRIYFPLIDRKEAEQVSPKLALPEGGTETILLADDDDKVRRVAEIILRMSGYTVLTAGNGEEAVRVFEEHATDIDIALLDVIMPKLGGKAVLDHIRDKKSEIRVIFISGYSTDHFLNGDILDEGIQFIQKPYEHDTLLRKVRKALDEN
jgi:PAS domain S-box-containing protein